MELTESLLPTVLQPVTVRSHPKSSLQIEFGIVLIDFQLFLFSKYSQFSLFVGVFFYYITKNTELSNTEWLLLEEIQS